MKMKKICKDKLDIVVLFCIVAVFAYFFIFHDVVECGDSFQYENQYPMREPVYSLMLQLLQVLCGDAFMTATGFVQNLMAIICTYWTYRRVRTIFDFKILFSIGTAGMLMAPHLLTPLASKTHLILTNSIMTEGITISLYYLWITMMIGILKGYYDSARVKSAQVISFILGLILAMTRGQMILCMVIWLIVVAFVAIIGNENVKKKLLYVLVCVVAVLAAVVAKGQLTKWYNLAETGYYVNTISSKPMMLANLVYVCNEDDADYIQDEEIREAFRAIVREADSQKLTIENAPSGIISMGKFHESGHETLNFDIIDPAMRLVVKSKYNIDESEFINLMIHEDMICDTAVKQLLPNVFGRYFHNYVIIAVLGFVRSVAVDKSVLPLFALLIYLAAAALTIWGLFKKERRDNAFVMVMIVVAICGNVLGTSLMIQCITRYMIYNLPFFYIAGMGLIKDIFRKIK